ncbi:MAG: cupin [Alphaproteobacteria bacterium HGW-Alphaproteobacteria-2]|nr:MAG: cupin [Alphaproteobacteria bacterium HGW-Alphaproteobacteria-2]
MPRDTAHLDRLTTLLRGLAVEQVARPPLPGASLLVCAAGEGYRLCVPDGAVGGIAAIRLRWGGAGNPLVAAGALSVDISPGDPAAALVRLIVAELARPQCGAGPALAGCAEALIVHFLRAVLARGVAAEGMLAGLADARLARALVAIHDHPGRHWRAGDLAAEAGMSRSAFMARFGAVMGEGPMGYLRRWRMARAREALARGEPVGAVARRYGYLSADAFRRAFRGTEGHAPGATARGGPGQNGMSSSISEAGPGA